MAAIDKLYGTKAQHDTFREWCAALKPEALEFFYDWMWDDDGVHPITNFPDEIDFWLWVNCPLEFVTDRIREQYGLTGEPWAASGDEVDLMREVRG